MPVKYVCDGCGEILYEKRTPLRVGHPLKTPQEVIDILEGTCPQCRKELVFNAKNIECKELAVNKMAFINLWADSR